MKNRMLFLLKKTGRKNTGVYSLTLTKIKIAKFELFCH